MSFPRIIASNVLEKAKSESYSKERASQFERIEKRFTNVRKAKLKSKLEEFRITGSEMSFLELSSEEHSSELLGKFMRANGMPRPGARWETHHLISGNHPEAEASRAIFADEDITMRIDDPDNGCWMPKTKADARPTLYPNAIGHNRIHRERYYNWIFNSISIMKTSGQVSAFLLTVRAQLMHGNIKEELILQQDIDAAEYKDWLKQQL
jgi:hypothetical protein